jgi:tetratricopeptide (TPR) repeat protein
MDWRSLYRRFKKKSAKPVLFVHLMGPAGVGRSTAIDAIKKDLGKGAVLWEFSCLEGPLLPRLRAAVPAKNKNLIEAWSHRLKTLGPRRRVAIILRDFHALEQGEQKTLEEFLKALARLQGPLLILLETRNKHLGLKLPPPLVKKLEVKSLKSKECVAWLKRFAKVRALPSQAGKKFYRKTRGLPREMLLWGFYLKNHIPDFLNPRQLKSWPGNRAALLRSIVEKLMPAEAGLLQVWGLHPSWLNDAALAAASGQSPARVGSALKRFSQWGWVEASISAPARYFLKEGAFGEIATQRLGPEEKQGIHRRLFSFFKDQVHWPYRETWLAYHASHGGLSREAFCWNILAGESYEARGQWDAAWNYFSYALGLAQDDFQRAYLKGILGETCLTQKKFPQAWSALQEAKALAEKIPWLEFQQNFNLSLGQLLSHLGRYRSSEVYYLQTLKVMKLRGLEEERYKVQFQLGMSYLEQARYGEAEKIFSELKKYYSDTGDALGSMGVQLGLLQIFIALGRVQATMDLMEDTGRVLRALPESLWQPLFKLLIAKFYSTQGRLGQALKILEEAARGFEANGDLPGKVEVLLAMSAPMLEYGLIQDAQKIMELLGSWPGLDQSPALQHSIQLRRMAVSAFSGKWVEKDFALAGQNALEVGRTEDWLLFWFHLALASKNFSETKFFNYFIGKARELAQKISEQSDAVSAKSFLQRPDVARIFRLSEERKAGLAAAVSARRETGVEGPAEAATLAPPVQGPRSEPL